MNSIECNRNTVQYILVMSHEFHGIWNHWPLGFNLLHNDNCKLRWETFKFWHLVHLILKTLRYITTTMKIEHGWNFEFIKTPPYLVPLWIWDDYHGYFGHIWLCCVTAQYKFPILTTGFFMLIYRSLFLRKEIKLAGFHKINLYSDQIIASIFKT